MEKLSRLIEHQPPTLYKRNAGLSDKTKVSEF
jgi:hypothetical protein